MFTLVLASLAAAGISLIFLVIMFVPMERVFPANANQKFFRPKWRLDFYFFLGQYLLWGAVIVLFLQFLEPYLFQLTPVEVKKWVSNRSTLVQLGIVLILSDLIIYWGHRLQHKVDFLWRFHKVHHSADHLDWLASYREHPLDSLYTIGLINLPILALGFPIETIVGIITFRGIWAIYIHSNVRLNIGPLKYLIGSPDIHHWHHDLDRRAGNYANISPLMDVIFRTYKCPDKEPEQFGISELTPKTYLGQMIEPFLPRKIWEKLTNK